MTSMRIYYSGSSYIDCWCTRFDAGNWDITLETFLDSGSRNTLFEHVTPGAVTELMNILGQPYHIDSTFTSSNTLVIEPIDGYGLSSLVEGETIGVKSISDHFISPNYFSVKIEGQIIHSLSDL